MTRALVLGDRLREAAAALALEQVVDGPDLVLVDLADPDAVATASQEDPMVPRLAIAGPEQVALLRALGRAGFEVLTSAEPAALGPLVARLAPPRPKSATRLVLVTGVAGGCGRTLLAASLAVRLATRGSVALIDLTGSGSAAWWLRVGATPWSEIEGVTLELTPEHLAVVASEHGAVRVVGGSGSMPTAELGVAAVHAALALVDVVVVDAPPLSDDRTRSIGELADRILVLSSDDPASRAQLAAVAKDGHWILASRAERVELAGHSVMRSLPDDAAAVRAAADGDGMVGGRLGQAYDDLAELIAIDATE